MPTSNYFIAPFGHDLNTNYNGNIYYRLINDAQTLNRIGQEINLLPI